MFYDQLVLFKARRGAFKPKPKGEMIAAAPRTAVASAKVERGTIMSVLRVGLQDGSTWAFDVPRFYLGGANRLVAALAQPAAQALYPGSAGRLSADRR